MLPILTVCAEVKYPTDTNNKTKPNVIIINADDLGYGDIGAYGATLVKTPNIDKLAREGHMFTDFHAASAVCSPSRYALITGEYPARKDYWYPVFAKAPLMIAPEQITIAKVMKDAGYATAIIGKWHLGFGDGNKPVDWNGALKPGPLEVGFDYYFGVPVVNSHPPFVYVENHRVVGLVPDDPLVYGKPAKTRGFDEKVTFEEFKKRGNSESEYLGGAGADHALYKDRKVATVLKNKSLDWIKKHKDNPFFLYLATTNIHHPFTPAPRFIGTSKAGAYGDFVHELDWLVGEVMRTLQEEGLADNTLLIFTSDNGGMLNRGGQTAWETGHRLNGNLLGFKFDAWEGGHGLTKQESRDSYNLLPALTGSLREPIRDYLLLSPVRRTHITLRKGKWLYIPAQDSGGFNGTEVGQHTLGGAAAHKFTGQVNSDIENGRVKENAPPAQLYDLSSDPSEAKNLYKQHPEVVTEMENILEQIMKK